MFRPSIKNLIIFLAITGLTGFVLGTGVLMGPVRVITAFCRSHESFTSLEDAGVRLMMVLLLFSTLGLGMRFTSSVLNSKRKDVSFGIPLLLFVMFAMVLFFWMNPERFRSEEKQDFSTGERFVTGPYPGEETLSLLKEEGFTGVISLLHPAVVPFEPKLLAEERVMCEEAGIELIHIPMLPWVSENRDSLERLEVLAASSGGRYYIHCYLGKDRVNVAANVLKRAGGEVAVRTDTRNLAECDHLDRGAVVQIDQDVFLTPCPTREELIAYILAPDVKTVISLMDDESESAAGLVRDERSMLEANDIKFIHFPVKARGYDASVVLDAVSAAGNAERPVVIHGFNSPSFRLDAFASSYRSGLSSIPLSLLERNNSLKGPFASAPNVVAGEAPESLSVYRALELCGIKDFLYIGSPESERAIRDKRFTAVAGYSWHQRSDAEGLDQLLGSRGPWYVYGDGAKSAVASMITVNDDVVPEVFDKNPAVVPEPQESSPEELPDSMYGRLAAFVTRAIPGLKLILLFAPCMFMYAFAAASYAGWLKVSRNVRTPYTRKIFHFLIFTMAGVLQALAGLSAVMLFGGIVSLFVLYALYRGAGFPFYEAMARPTDEPHRSFYIFVPLVTTALGGVCSNLFFPAYAYIGYLVGGWGDAIGEPVGTRWGKHRYSVPSLLGVKATRSLEGSAAVTFAGFAAAFFGLVIAGTTVTVALPVAAACGIGGALVESVSTHGLDNFTIQVASSAAAFFMMGILG